MAKSKGFFSKRTGSVGDQTYTILDGKQITKQKISHMTNPQSSKQATQRLRILCAQRFLIAFGNELNHSFENVAVGRKSKQHFLSMAMSTIPVCPMYKGQNGFMPETYVISQGQLPKLAAVCDPATSDASAKFERVFFDAEDTNSVAKLVKKNGWTMGDQLTAFAVIAEKDSHDPGQTLAVVGRVILDENTQLGGGATIAFEDADFTLNILTGELSYEGAEFDNIQLVGIAVVRTHADQAAGKFRYSSETMDVAESWKAAGASNFGPARASYMKAAKALDSELYMRQAEAQDAAAIVYSNPTAFTGTDVVELVNNTPVGLAVQDSSGAYHPVYDSLENTYSGVISTSAENEYVPTIQSMAPTDAASASEGENVKLIIPTLKWDEQGAEAAFGETVTLGAPVKFVDIVDILINA